MQAVVMYELALHFNSHCAEACNNLGVIYKDRDNLDKAVECYTVSISIDTTPFGVTHCYDFIYISIFIFEIINNLPNQVYRFYQVSFCLFLDVHTMCSCLSFQIKTYILSRKFSKMKLQMVTHSIVLTWSSQD